jgi:hypothetical protein
MPLPSRRLIVRTTAVTHRLPPLLKALVLTCTLVGPAKAAGKVDFARDVRPILANNCFACHGPDPKPRKAGLRLDLRTEAVKPARSGAAPVVPGQASASELVKRILTADPGEVMPPPKTKKTLQPAEKETLRRWIDEGAAYPAHWSFVPPVRPPVPVVKTAGWNRDEIDAFILARIENAGLKPSAEADPATLIRRVSLDLRGLPPSLQEAEAFLSDTAPGAYERMVERMLASPHYGEKMGLLWLDLARFGDTSGYEYDSSRQMWLWRDWVIAAFNRNMPFDQFTVEQLAGDLLPGATVSQKIASGFNRNTRFNEEGGADPEEFVVRYTVDRTNTLGQVWLGLTVGCAECHSHKYDPISQKEYYQLYAFFTGIAEPAKSGNHNQPLPPLLRFPTPEQDAAIAKARADQAVLEKQIAASLQAVKYGEPANHAGPAADRHKASQRAWEERARNNLQLEVTVRDALKVEPAKRTDVQKAALRNYYLRFVYSGTRPVFDSLNKEMDEAAKRLKEADDAVASVMVSEEMPQRRPAYILVRGDFQNRGEKVEPGVPAALPGLFPPVAHASGSPAGAHAPGSPSRLALARWLVRADHPLTARVMVNRLWAQMFGTGLVKTIGDFGTQGELPSHPELLDWLATEFVASGWDVKALLKKIALSATYRQSSALGDRIPEGDAHNRLLSRSPRYRLSAEEVRDNALAVARLLNRRIGGPSVMPYQPAKFYSDRYDSWKWAESPGADLYRRGMYTFWRRTSLHPMFAIFDAPSREECTVYRSRTNTPLQALVTLNDPTFVEAARVFAQRVLSDGPADLDGRIGFAFRTALTRPPTAAERAALTRQHGRLLARYKTDPRGAAELVTAGRFPATANLDLTEHAVWTGLANLLLNLDETITRE